MPHEARFAVYLSHSWRPRDVDLNLLAWQELAGDGELLVDMPEEPGANPPYYINRIEELLRRTDLFLSVLTYRDSPTAEFAGTDAHLHCSPYSLFEIRLAERADIPRLVLYERRTGFRPPRIIRPWEAYIPFDRGLQERLPERRQWETVIRAKIQQWKQWAADHRKPVSYEQSTGAVLLTGASQTGPAWEVLEDCLRDGGYEPVRCDPGRLRSSDALRLLRETGLTVADFAKRDPLLDQLYAAAHALGLPSIRLVSSGSENAELPWILRGDPGGYQNDIVEWKKPEDLQALVKPRIRAMFRLSRALRDAESLDYLQSKRYSQFFVFISHTIKPPERALVDHIYALLKERHVTPFEYHQVNVSGTDWQEALNDSLEKTTHFVVLLSPGYELSQTCTYEIEQILSRKDRASILPFMVGGRTVPHPKLNDMHNTLLSGPDARANAELVVEQVMGKLDAALE